MFSMGAMLRRMFGRMLSVVSLALAAHVACAESVSAERTELAGSAVLLEIKGAIGPATADFLKRSLLRAQREGAVLVVIRMNTPGGLDAATRDIDQAILASSVPVAVYVAPEGARAASAGTFIVYASHIAAMAPATNLGAATPVSIGGGDIGAGDGDESGKDSKDSRKDGQKDSGSDDDGDSGKKSSRSTAMGRKVLNDAVAHIRSLAELRGRNAQFAEDAVRKASTLTAREALERGVIDLIARDMDDLLLQIDGREVTTSGAKFALHTKAINVRAIEPDWRSQLLSVITDPTMAYLLLLIGLYGLVFEGYHPGAVLPGVVGAICLLLALYALQVLPVNYVGLALIILGIALIVAETVMPGFGALGIGGVIALVVGSIMLLDVDLPGYSVSRGVIFGIAAVSAFAFAMALQMAARARRRPVITGAQEMLGHAAVVLDDFQGLGQVRIRGEIWQAACASPVKQAQSVRVERIEGLVLHVRPT